jgi:molybdenum cofactor biosynthesis enzyme
MRSRLNIRSSKVLLIGSPGRSDPRILALKTCIFPRAYSYIQRTIPVDDRSRYTLSQFSADAQVAVGLSSTLVDRLASDAPRQQELRRALEVVASLAAKSYPTVFPSAHQSLIDDIQCRLEVGIGGIQIHTHLKALSKASLGGVVQFAAASAGLCLVELLRGEDPGVKIMEIRLLQSKGGRSGEAATFPRQLNSAVIVLSDSRAAGK